ncbi:MAG: hypothetical protein P8013_12580 [Candidatus Sulfobium sp.]
MSRFRLDDETYECGTENLAGKCKLVTRIYLKGEVLSTSTSDYGHMAGAPDFQEKLWNMMEEQHNAAMESFLKENGRPQKTMAHYADEIRLSLKGGDRAAALKVARIALERFPSDPFFLSYCGYLVAVVEKKPKEGTMMCENAINILKRSRSTDSVFFMPLFYLHLGRAYLKGDRKKAALKALQQGLKYDRRDGDLLSEIKAFGIRKRPVVPFLERGHPVNKYLGKIRHRLQTGK